MRHDQAHPPVPPGATTIELQTIGRLHRAATTSSDQANRPVMLDGVNLLENLIQARNKRQRFTDQWDHC